MTQQTTQLRFDTIPPREEWKYELYGLPYNPFQVAGLAELVPTLPIYRLDVANEIRDYVSSTFKKQEYGGLLVRGEYGMGKSHLLRYMTNQINVQLGTRGSERAIAIYVENPETSMEGLISRLIESLERKTIEQLAWNILVKRLRKIGAQGLLDRIPSSLFVGTVTGPRLQEILTMHLLNRERFLEEWSALFYGDREYEAWFPIL